MGDVFADGLKVKGDVRGWKNPDEPADSAVREFCPSCGTPLFTRYQRMVFIKAGTLDAAAELTPTRHRGTISRSRGDFR